MRRRIWRGVIAVGIVLCLVTVVFVALGKNPFLRSPSEAELQRMLPGESRQIFEETGAFTLLSLGYEIDEDDKAYDKSFHGYQVLGKTQITNRRERNRLAKKRGSLPHFWGRWIARRLSEDDNPLPQNWCLASSLIGI